ncbi:hypothetical protein BH09PSE5_BH09PSE5_06850 [soil metagenome]
MTPSENTGKVLTRRIQAADGTTVALHYEFAEANAMRTLIQSVLLRGSKRPSLSLIARRSMQLYLDQLAAAKATAPDLYASEIAELDRMVTRVPKPAPKSKRKTTQVLASLIGLGPGNDAGRGEPGTCT